ncbi:hypothetical protein BGZ49_003567 [Haplosporangium sp. Z 27]|nr:hypothetical protein BGZ49_003567 [Haplosporangium sp. Z 27]
MSLDKVYGSILRHRANLRMFSVVGDDVDPYWVFGGLSQEDDGQGWLCRDLESLEVTLSWPDSSVRGPEQMSREWDTVLRQIGKLSQLRHLSVKSQDMQLYPASAFLEECGGLCELRTLVLSAPDTNHAWRVSQIESLLHYCPWLVNLDLGGLTLDSAETVQQWLDNKCEREIDFSFFCEEEEEEEEDGDGDESEAEYEECEEYEDDEEY